MNKLKRSINFFSTTKKKGLYKYLIESSILHASRLTKKNVEINYLYKKIPSIKFLILFIKEIFSFRIYNLTECIKIKYNGIDLGLYAVSMTFRQPRSHSSKIFLYLNLTKYFFLGGSMVDSAKKIVNKVDAVYIDHAIYIHGIYYKLFADYKKIIYSNQYPRGLFYIDYKKKNSQISLPGKIFRLSKKIDTKNCKLLKKKKLIKAMRNPNTIPWVRNTKFKSKIKDEKILKNIDYIVYAHSFLDGNISYGYDGFITLKDWLIFTIDNLIKKNAKTVVKAHPNFYNNDFGEIAKTDKVIFEEIKEKYKYSDIIFMNEPIKNSELLKKVKKKTILITHHGTIAMEAGLFGFKCISSESTFWDNSFDISNQWSDRNSYSKMIKKNWSQLKFANQKDLIIFTSQLFSEYGNFGKKFWSNNFDKYIGDKHSLVLHKHTKRIKKSDQRSLLNQIQKNIFELKYLNKK